MKRAWVVAGWSSAVVLTLVAGCAPSLRVDGTGGSSPGTSGTTASAGGSSPGTSGATTSTGGSSPGTSGATTSSGGTEVCGSVSGHQDTGTSAPIVAGPAGATVHAGSSFSVAGIGITDAGAATNPGAMVVQVSVNSGTIAMTVNGAQVAGSGTSSITYSGSLSALDAALATLTYTALGAATGDVLRIMPTDQFGQSNALSIPMTVTPGATCMGSGGTGGSGGSSSSSSGGSGGGDATGTTAVQTLKVLGGFGMNLHTTCCSAAYSDLSALAGDINYIWSASGAKPTLRDSPIGNSAILTSWPQLASATGGRFDAYIAELQPSAYQGDLALMRQLPHGIVFSYEGPNEPDSASSNGICTLGKTACLQAAASYMPTVWAAGQADGIAVIQTSFGNAWPAPGSYGTTGDLSAYATYGNAHTYFNTGSGSRAPSQGGLPGNHGTINFLNEDAAQATPGKPIAITEFGYVVSGSADAVPQYVQGVYTMEVILDAFGLGNPYYFYYALYDDGSGNWGVFNTDHTPRPAATHLQNLFTILGDQGSSALTFTPGKLDFTLTGMPSGASPGLGGNALLLQKSSGDFELVLWNEQNINAGEGAATNVTLSFGSTAMKSVDLHDPTLGTASQQHLTSVTTMTVSLPQHPIVLEIVHP